MKIARFRKPILLPCVALILLTLRFALLANAGLRGPGKYSGVVVFDRWHTCFLLSGPYITYISENVKNDLRPYTGKAIQVDASDARHMSSDNPDEFLSSYRFRVHLERTEPGLGKG
jgi:hypothetical protein